MSSSYSTAFFSSRLMADPESKFALMAKEAGISGFEQAEKNLIELEDKKEIEDMKELEDKKALEDKKDDTDTEDEEDDEAKKDEKEDMVDGSTRPKE